MVYGDDNNREKEQRIKDGLAVVLESEQKSVLELTCACGLGHGLGRGWFRCRLEGHTLNDDSSNALSIQRDFRFGLLGLSFREDEAFGLAVVVKGTHAHLLLDFGGERAFAGFDLT